MILVTGRDGQLGTAFRSLLPVGDETAVFVDVAELDLSRSIDIESTLRQWSPEAIINCAAYTAVDKAEEDEALAYSINAEAVAAMARYAETAEIPFVTFSTDYVFGGNGSRPYVESDATDPINAYGRTKRIGERMALEAHPEGTIVIRTSWLVSGTHPNFIATMLKLGGRGKPFTVVDDQHGCPTMARDLAAGAIAALEARAHGILHLTNEGPTTWCAFARAALELAGMDPELAQPCTTADYPTPAPRPSYSVLGSERVERLRIGGLPPWRESLADVVAGLLEASETQ